MLYMLRKNPHRLGRLNFNQIKQVCLNDKCMDKIKTPIIAHDVVSRSSLLNNRNSEENENNHTLVSETIELSHSNCIEVNDKVVNEINDHKASELISVSSQIKNVEELIKKQKIVRQLYRKNSW